LLNALRQTIQTSRKKFESPKFLKCSIFEDSNNDKFELLSYAARFIEIYSKPESKVQVESNDM